MMGIGGPGAITNDAVLKGIKTNSMSHKSHTFGGLRLYAAIMKAPGEFKAFLEREGYTESELIIIKKAFESLSSKTPVENGHIF